jgi:Ca2+-binding RTX toxin-like protein
MKKLLPFAGSILAIACFAAVAVQPAGAATPTCFGSPDSHTSTSSFDPETEIMTIYGTPGNDVIIGTGFEDLIYGYGGNDKICSLGEEDHVIGGPGDDMIEGGNAADNLWGGPGNDVIKGGNGDDHVVGENGEDQLYGGEKDDNILGGAGNDKLYGELGNDKLDGDNAAPTYGFGTEDLCVGGPGENTAVDCELF